MANFVELWVYLASAPLFGLTATLAVYVLAPALAAAALPPASEASTSRPQRERSAALRCHRGQPSATTAGPSKKWTHCAPAKYVG